VQIAEIVVTPTTIQTPVGPIDRSRARWALAGAVPASQSTPAWASVTAFLLMLCTGFASLLLLLVKETDLWSSTLIVTDGQVTFTTQVYSPEHGGVLPDPELGRLGAAAGAAGADRPVRPPERLAVLPAGPLVGVEGETNRLAAESGGPGHLHDAPAVGVRPGG
jgi:hypothetical protein